MLLVSVQIAFLGWCILVSCKYWLLKTQSCPFRDLSSTKWERFSEKTCTSCPTPIANG